MTKNVILFIRREPKLKYASDKLLARYYQSKGFKVCVKTYKQIEDELKPEEPLVVWFEEYEKFITDDAGKWAENFFQKKSNTPL